MGFRPRAYNLPKAKNLDSGKEQGVAVLCQCGHFKIMFLLAENDQNVKTTVLNIVSIHPTKKKQ